MSVKIKVRDYIKHLQTLDPDKVIYVEYDKYAKLSPIPREIAGEYVIEAW